MNRREALAALVALPGTPRISVARMEPDDVIVVECETRLTQEQRASIKAAFEAVWPGRRGLVMDGGMHLKVVKTA